MLAYRSLGDTMDIRQLAEALPPRDLDRLTYLGLRLLSKKGRLTEELRWVMVMVEHRLETGEELSLALAA